MGTVDELNPAQGGGLNLEATSGQGSPLPAGKGPGQTRASPLRRRFADSFEESFASPRRQPAEQDHEHGNTDYYDDSPPHELFHLIEG